MASCESRDLPDSPWLHIDSNLPVETIQWRRDERMTNAINPTHTKGLWKLRHSEEE